MIFRAMCLVVVVDVDCERTPVRSVLLPLLFFGQPYLFRFFFIWFTYTEPFIRRILVSKSAFSSSPGVL